jgi:ATP-binding cassette, subfamily B, bacterial PglK
MNFVRFLRKILNKKEKFYLIYVFLLMILNTLFELLSVGIILPIIAILFKKDIDFMPEIFNELVKSFEYIYLIKYVIILLILVYLIKNLFILFYNYQLKLYLRNLQTRILYDLYKLYMLQSYSFFLQKDTGTILRNLQTSRVISLCLVSYLTIILEILIVIIFTSYLLYVNFKLTVIITVLFIIFGSILYLSSKNKLFTWGIFKQSLDAKINQLIIQSFSLIKNIKIFNKEKKMNDFFKKLVFEYENLDLKLDMIQQIPRAIIEMLGVISISLLVIVLSNMGKDNLEIFALVALYAAVAFRLMPSSTRIIVAGQRIRSFAPNLNLIENEFLENEKNISDEKNEKYEPLKFKNLKFKNVNFSYEKKEKNILSDISLEINRGEIIGIYGESGSGKSTFVNLISGLLKPQKGTIQVNNENLELKKINWLASLGYVPQQVTLFNDTIETNISFFENQDKNENFNKKITKVLEQANLKNLIESLPDKVNTIVGENAAKLSGGQVQRIGIARALFNNPEFIIFDESTSSLDLENEKDIMKFVYSLKKNKTVIVISHKKEILERCDKIFEVKNKNINQIK